MNTTRKSALFAATALSLAYGAPAMAQSSENAEDGMGNDIVVTARRTEEKLQDVPISITVLSEKTLANNNISNAKDLATYTPGLTTNNRFGSDNTTWTIRGFAQEQRTTATVGTYFADVVAPRGSGATQGGDGAGPGNLFDLSNVQVLKGPQGTLQGRNSTGGAVMLVPKRPTDKLEGYLEGSAGDYSMYRVQGVINVPLSETFKVRLGFDHQKRDGYLQNAASVIGFGPNGDAGGSTNYWAFRGSVVWNVTPDIENYTVGNYSRSKSTGSIPKITQILCREPYSGITGVSTTNSCGDLGQNVTGLVTANGPALLAQQAFETANCNGNWWCVTNPLFDAQSNTRTWQVINATTWKASDSLTVKNILSYGQFKGYQVLDLFGQSASGNGAATLSAVTNPTQIRANVAITHGLAGLDGGTNAESSFVEELQFQGHGEKFNWQGGLYLEINNPLGISGTENPQADACAPYTGTLTAGFFVADSLMQCGMRGTASSAGRLNISTTKTQFRDKAIYWQGIYSLTQNIKLTAGIRYTWDEMKSTFNVTNGRFFPAAATETFNSATPNNITIPGVTSLGPNGEVGYFANGAGYCVNDVAFGKPSLTSATNPYFPMSDVFNRCLQTIQKKTSAPTWLLGIDYKPSDNVLLYVKYSRGYRQGGVTPFGLDQLQSYDKEKVDTYEVGAKASWRGAMPGYLNASAYTNNFTDQQLQIGIQCNPTSSCPQTTAIINAGKSRMTGFEIETGISPFRGFRIEASYAYLNTKLLAITDVATFVVSRNPLFTTPPADLRPLPVGTAIPNAQPHKLVLSASYTLPLDEKYGKITFGGTMVYSSKYRAVSDPAVYNTSTGCLAPGGVPLTVNSSSGLLACSAAAPIAYASEYGVLPGNKVLNLNVNWENVASLPIDAALFVTNVTNEHLILHTNVGSTSGYLTSFIGEPRMWGFRLKYRFGN